MEVTTIGSQPDLFGNNHFLHSFDVACRRVLEVYLEARKGFLSTVAAFCYFRMPLIDYP